MKRTIAFLTMMMVALAGEAAIVYRGRLVPNSRTGTATTFSGAVTRDMTFRLYDAGGTRCCTVERKGVPIAPDGTFSVVLESAEVTESVTKGEAVSIGLSIGKAPEITPRRHLLPLGRVNHATVAGGLARDARVGTLTSKALVCDSLTVNGRVSVKSVVGTDGGLDRIAYRLPPVGFGESLELVRGDGLSVFGTCQQMKLDNGQTTKAASPGDYLCRAPADGAVTIRCVSSGRSFSFARFCRKNELIRVPFERYSVSDRSQPTGFAVDFHPFFSDVSDK